MSVVIGDDIVPRLSIHSSQHLIAQIWHELESHQIPKYKVLLGGYRESPDGNERTLDSERGRDHAKDGDSAVPEEAVAQQVELYIPGRKKGRGT